ncbi:helix-turn-helix domain-containing protein [Streptosporangium sp. NPDC002524]|uniref:winged helix-turn-helix transcriptional regulator n=1 Tax=Streptosporangium sp. NPDC002524 TaxID=3154537 RepID=UPI00332DED3F
MRNEANLEPMLRANGIARQVIAHIGDKWSLLVIAALGPGAQRFSRLKARIEGINQRMLTRTLRALERDGIVERNVYPTSPPTVEYVLTRMGRDLSVAVTGICEWARHNLDEVEASQRLFDERSAKQA